MRVSPFISRSFVTYQQIPFIMKYSVYLLAAATLFFASCGDEAAEQDDDAVMKPAPIEMTEVQGSPEFEGAEISMGDVTTAPEGDMVNVTFNFNVKNYELMNQTDDAATKMCANSDKGQHIHFIMDNEPYAALYEPTHSVSLEKNSEHYLLAFLSRSYHESIKSPGAVLLYHFKVDENGKVEKLEDPTSPMVFYSRPKGDYVGEDNTANLLFDFYTWNTEMGNNTNHVLAHIKGEGVDTTMVVTDWKAYFLHNMPMGKPSITLTLVDKDGNKLDGPMTEVTREFNLSLGEPLEH